MKLSRQFAEAAFDFVLGRCFCDTKNLVVVLELHGFPNILGIQAACQKKGVLTSINPHLRLHDFFTMVSRSLAVLLIATLLATTSPAEEVLDGIAAVVNGDVITFSQVRELIGPRELTLREALKGQELMDKVKELRISAVNELIDRQLVLQEFEKNKFAIPDFVINDHINTIIREQFGNDRLAFIRALQAQGFTIQRFRKLETDKMIVQAMRSRSVKVNPILSPAQIEGYYSAHRVDYSTPDQVKLRMIVMHNDSSDTKRTLAEIRSKIENGQDFAKMAQMYSEDSSKSRGGDWGWIDRKTLNETLTTAAFALKAGSVSKVLVVGDSYYLLYAEARKNGASKSLASIHDEVANKLVESQRQEAQQKWIRTLRSKAFVKIY